MNVDENKVTDKSMYKGQTYYFCCLACKQAFDNNPEKYIMVKPSGL